jgi:hypothetical protein
MSGTDYVQTPNLSLFKPLSGMDVGSWGTHLNANMDTLDGLFPGGTGTFLPLAGGTMGGALNLTATGGTVARSEQARWADEANVLDFGADNTGATDASSAIQAALNTGKNVYAPAGTYRLNHAVTVGSTTAAQRLRGDGLQTTLLIDQSFDPTATNGVFTLQGREQFAPTMQDLWIQFTQPSDLASRATMKTLASGGTSGTGGTGIQYPPAIYFGLSNRFKLMRIRISNAWDGICQNSSPSNSGGWWMQDIEISGYHYCLSVGSNLDFSHIKGWHHWDFGMTNPQTGVTWDGNTYAMRIGDGVASQAISVADVAIFKAKLRIDTSGTWAHISNLMMDSAGAVIEHANSLWTEISNSYFTDGYVSMQAGVLQITNLNGWPPASGGMVQQTGGYFCLTGGNIQATPLNSPIVVQSAGVSSYTNVQFRVAGGTWVVSPMQVTGTSVINFVGNTINGATLPASGFLQLTNDSPQNCVAANGWAGATGYFIPPGPLGHYGEYGIMRAGSAIAAPVHTFGEQASLASTYGSGAHTVTIASVDSTGRVNLGYNAVGIDIGSPLCDSSARIVANPTGGTTVNLNNNNMSTVLNTTATVATLTVVMPPNPMQNQMLRLLAAPYGITALTLSPNTGQTINGAPTTMAGNSAIAFIYMGTQWFRMQ